MDIVADILLGAGALGAALYCYVLGKRLRKFNNLKDGMGGAVAVLSAQVDDLEKTLEAAQNAASASGVDLRELTERAEEVSRQLQMQIASLHDVVPTTEAAEVPRTQEAPQEEEAPPAASATVQPPEPESELIFTRRRA